MKMIPVPVLVYLFLASTSTGYVSGYPEKSYALYFPNKDVTSYVNIWGMPSLTAFTICFWMRTSDASNVYTVLSYGVPGERSHQDNEIIVESVAAGLRLVVKHTASIVLGSGNDGNWHHNCFTWQNSDGAVKYYKDGTLHNQGSGLKTNHTLGEGGSLVLGQEQDSPGGGFQSFQAFQGYLANLNIWSHVLNATEVQRLSESCLARDFEGNVYKWNDFIYGVKGKTAVFMPSPCKTK